VIRTAAIPSSREFRETEAARALAEKEAAEATVEADHPVETEKVVASASA
jgi:hypothetical protein